MLLQSMPLRNNVSVKIQKLKSVIAQLNRECILDTYDYLMLKILPLYNACRVLGCDPSVIAKVLFVSTFFVIFLASLAHLYSVMV